MSSKEKNIKKCNKQKVFMKYDQRKMHKCIDILLINYQRKSAQKWMGKFVNFLFKGIKLKYTNPLRNCR